MNVLVVEDESRIAKRVERMTRELLGEALQSLKQIDSPSGGIEVHRKPFN